MMGVHITYINYASGDFLKAQKYSLNKALKLGCVDEVFCYTFSDIDTKFQNDNKEILNNKKGGGYWLWKPYFILKSLHEIKDGDFLFYCDTGAYPTGNLSILCDELNAIGQDIMGFSLPLVEKQWTKQDLIKKMGCNSREYTETPQILASYILIRKTEKSIKFFEEYLSMSSSIDNIKDIEPSEEKGDCIEHRHDQSIFSLLYKKNNLIPFRDPSQFGSHPHLFFRNVDDGRVRCFAKPKGEYPELIFHWRRGNPKFAYVKYFLKNIIFSRIKN